ncbi:MAG: methylmalonyl Co-A mutase-associated GTPase MeaB [Chloroflexi bacterium]|nr:methylmalonyl Co-A mutase-associated GTPase MeaB [Chloroflexota bacterium]
MGLASRILEGDVQAAARLISHVENETPQAVEEMSRIYPHTGKAFVIGITGPPGAGKSTLTDSLIRAFRQRQLSVGVVAVDPSSAFTGGAILGDRIRMQKSCTDPGVFIRSLATRGWIGGLAKATLGAIHVMDALGKDIILVETVGSGQIEIDITRAADCTVLILTPGAGDEIQMMKAGILEAADIFVINKADLEGAQSVKAELEIVLGMRDCRPEDWKPQVFLTEAMSDKGVEAVAGEVLRHQEYLKSGGRLELRQKDRAKFELLENLEGYLKSFIVGIDDGSYLDRLAGELLDGRTDPHSATLEIARRFASDYIRKLHEERSGNQA